MCGSNSSKLRAAIITSTLQSLPVQPDHVSHIDGPYLNFKQVGTGRAVVHRVSSFMCLSKQWACMHARPQPSSPPSDCCLTPPTCPGYLQVDGSSVDVRVVQSFRAHFDSELRGHPRSTALVEEHHEDEEEGVGGDMDCRSGPCGCQAHDNQQQQQGEAHVAPTAVTLLAAPSPFADLSVLPFSAGSVGGGAGGARSLVLPSPTHPLHTSPGPPNTRQQIHVLQADLHALAHVPSAGLVAGSGGEGGPPMQISAVVGAAPVLAVAHGGGGWGAGHDDGGAVPPAVSTSSCQGEWELDPRTIELGRRIAVGGFAEVFLARYQGTLVAVKRLYTTDAGKEGGIWMQVR